MNCIQFLFVLCLMWFFVKSSKQNAVLLTDEEEKDIELFSKYISNQNLTSDNFVNTFLNDHIVNETLIEEEDDLDLNSTQTLNTDHIDQIKLVGLTYSPKQMEVFQIKKKDSKLCFNNTNLNINKCYVQILNDLNYDLSKSYCETHFTNGRLITINSVDEKNFLIQNNLYYYWIAFKVKIALNIDLDLKIFSIKPTYHQKQLYKQELIKFDFNSNLEIDPIFKKIVNQNLWYDFALNESKYLDQGDIKISSSSTIKNEYLLIGNEYYCLEASLDFKNDKPIYVWKLKFCNQTTNSLICEIEQGSSYEKKIQIKSLTSPELIEASYLKRNNNNLEDEDSIHNFISQKLQQLNKIDSLNLTLKANDSFAKDQNLITQNFTIKIVLNQTPSETVLFNHNLTNQNLNQSQLISNNSSPQLNLTESKLKFSNATSEKNKKLFLTLIQLKTELIRKLIYVYNKQPFLIQITIFIFLLITIVNLTLIIYQLINLKFFKKRQLLIAKLSEINSKKHDSSSKNSFYYNLEEIKSMNIYVQNPKCGKIDEKWYF